MLLNRALDRISLLTSSRCLCASAGSSALIPRGVRRPLLAVVRFRAARWLLGEADREETKRGERVGLLATAGMTKAWPTSPKLTVQLDAIKRERIGRLMLVHD